MPDHHAIQVSQLTKIYPPDMRAVDALDLTVNEGEIMALLGPNGAGKSTTIRVLSTLSGFDSGKAFVGGIDVDEAPEQVRRTIGVVAQKTGVDYFLTGRENMTLQGHMYRMKKADIRSRIDELAEYFELKDSIDKPVMAYSGGMTRKLDIATALIHRPKILFLDEPTLGLDIRSRKILWRHIEELNRKFGLTILLTTHYLEEADKLAHRVAIINAGRIRIIGTPEELKNGIHGDSIVVSFENVGAREKTYAAKLKDSGIARETVFEGNNLHLYVDDGASSIPLIMEQAAPHDVHVKTLSLARPTLDDVFLKYTGASMAETAEEEPEQWWHQWAGKGGGGGDWKKQAAKWGYVEGEGGEDAEWQGNEWVDKDGNPRIPEGAQPAPDAGKKAEESQAPAESADKWRGNEWVDQKGRQKGDWGDSPDWKGNEWVDEQGKPKTDWSKPAAAPDQKPAPKAPAEEWKGNEWVDDKGRQQGDWGDAKDWQGNEWVDKDGKPRTDWNKKG
jgi:ABC-2 type transport system ATP-binding protein